MAEQEELQKKKKRSKSVNGDASSFANKSIKVIDLDKS